MRTLFIFTPFLFSCVDVAVTPIKDDTGDTQSTDTSTVATGVPSISAISLTPNPAFTDDLLILTVESDDGYGADADLTLSWAVNGADVANDTYELDGATFFEKGDTVSVSATPFSGEIMGDASTTEIIISNTTPEAPSALISPEEVHEGGDDMICELDMSSADLDEDNVSYSVAWEQNRSIFSDSTTTYWTGDTVPSAYLVEGDIWTCTFTPHDGEEAGEAVSVSTTILEVELKAADCTNEIDSLSLPTEHAQASGGGSNGIGSFFADSGLNGDERVWVMMDYNESTVLEYPSLTSLQTSTGATTIELDDDWDGTGHVVMNGVLYTNAENSEEIVATDISTGVTIAVGSLPDLDKNSTGMYSYGARTYLDFNVDGQSLYVIRSTNAAGGLFVVSELDPMSLTVLNTWTSPTAMRSNYSEAFIACGVLYGVDTSDDGMCFWCNDVSLDLSWDLATNTETVISIPLTNPGTSGYIGGISYNPADGLIYVTRGGTLGTITPTFR
jgi:hypothetical protein